MDVPKHRKPRRRGRRQPQEHRAPDNGRTILDYLNRDCWRAVLDFVPILDLLRSEPVSRQWQALVLDYLSHVRIGLEKSWYNYTGEHRNIVYGRDNTDESFQRWIKKLGLSVVTYHTEYKEGLRIIKEYCPNIEELWLHVVPDLQPPAQHWQVEAPVEPTHNFQRLRRLCLNFCRSMSDASVSQFLASNDLEELRVLVNDNMTGECFSNLKSTKLKRFVMKLCVALQMPPLMAIADRLTNLTKLVLKKVPTEIINDAHLLFDRMPKLEYLYVQYLNSYRHNVFPTDNRHRDAFFECVCKLRSLKFLHASHRGTAEQVEAVVRSCPELRELHLEESYAGAGFVAAATRLTVLSLGGFNEERSELLLACVRACPDLKWISVSRMCMTPELAVRVAAERRALSRHERLHVRLNDRTEFYDLEGSEHYKDIAAVLSFSSPHHDDQDSDGIFHNLT